MAAHDHLHEGQFDRDKVLYHGTMVEGLGWLDRPESDRSSREVHLGTEMSAQERLHKVHHDVGLPGKIWEARIRPDAKVSPEVFPGKWDEDGGQYEDLGDYAVSFAADGKGEYDVYPYVNAVEDRGSISVAAHPSALYRVRPTRLWTP